MYMEEPNKAIVIGGNHHNTLGVIRSLGRKGIMPYVIVTSGGLDSFVLKSKYIKKGWAVDGSEKAMEFVLKELASGNNKSVLIACHDVISSAFDINRDKLLPNFYVPGTKEPGKITRLMNKKAMGELASKMGLIVPKTKIVNANTVNEIDDVLFPCITKPVDSKSGSKDEIVICETKEKLKSFLTKHGKDYVVQRFIDKQFEFQLIGCSLDEGNEIIIPGVSVICRQTKSSNTGFLHYTSLDETYRHTVNAARLFIREIGYSGLFSVEFLRGKSGIDYFMEINFRNDGNTISVAYAGVNLPYIWYLYCTGADYKSEIVSIHDEYVMPEFAELCLFQQRQISWKQWRDDMKKATSYMDYAEDDPAPTNGWKRYNKLKSKAIIKRVGNIVLGKK